MIIKNLEEKFNFFVATKNIKSAIKKLESLEGLKNVENLSVLGIYSKDDDILTFCKKENIPCGYDFVNGDRIEICLDLIVDEKKLEEEFYFNGISYDKIIKEIDCNKKLSNKEDEFLKLILSEFYTEFCKAAYDSIDDIIEKFEMDYSEY